MIRSIKEKMLISEVNRVTPDKIVPFIFLPAIALCFVLSSCSKDRNEYITVKPGGYSHALRNPLKGLTTRGTENHPWATLAHTYIRWNELENQESDGIEKIIEVCDQKWKGVEEQNIKVIPRVYLHWSGDKKYWPEDMQEMDFSSQQFQERVLRLIDRLGECWDNDPRVAFIEMGIFGKWGEQHSPFPKKEMEKIVGDAFAEAFQNKKVSVRRNWERFTDHPYGVYWDSWAHYNQIWQHGNSIKKINEDGRYLINYVGGEAAYDWGESAIQPGPSPTESVAVDKHRNFIVNSIRWLHCTQLRWIADYDQNNEEAVKGAEIIQKSLGYRFELNEIRFSLTDSLKISFDVTNTGSAPFYYNWPVELALLDTAGYIPVWKSVFKNADIRTWLPGEGWTEPVWTAVSEGSEYLPDQNWNGNGKCEWDKSPQKYSVTENFKVNVREGTYILSLAVLDPATGLPSLRFATANYLNRGRHPFGIVNIEADRCYSLPADFPFDDPYSDRSLNYAGR